MRDVVIIADFCGSFDGRSNNRFITIADMLSDKCNVELITGDFCHENKSRLTSISNGLPFKVTLLNEKAYRRNVSVKRFLSHFIWGGDVYNYLKTRKKPDVIYSAVPTVYAAFLVSKYCQKKKIPFIIDIQDLWPDAFGLFFDIPILKHILFFPYKIIADKTYRRADYVFAVSHTYADRAIKVRDKCDMVSVVFLGTCLKSFDAYIQDESETIRKDDDEIWIGYCGTLSRSYDISCVIDSLGLLNDNRLRLIIMGDGPKRMEFEKRAITKGIRATFTGRLPYSEMVCLLNKCDIAINPITHNAAQSIINKHADYVAAGLPVISTQENKEFCDLVTNYHMGYNCRNEDAKDIAEKISNLISDEELRRKMGANARICAEELFDRGITYNTIIQTILEKAGE